MEDYKMGSRLLNDIMLQLQYLRVLLLSMLSAHKILYPHH